MNIVVLAGGLSVEREVSMSSGSLVCAALRRLGHNAVLVDVFFGPGELPAEINEIFERKHANGYTVGTQMPDIQALKASREDSGYGSIGKNVIELCRMSDIVYMGLHGDDGENGRMQAFLDVLGIKYTGSGYFGSALAMNKAVAKQIFLHTGIPTPKGLSFTKGSSLCGADSFGFPCVVKPVGGGSSLGVSIAQNKEELDAAIAQAFQLENEVLIEEYIAGREFSVGVLGEEVLPPIEIIPKEGFYDYAHKYQAGWTKEVCPAELDAETTSKMQQLTLAAHNALRLDVYSRGEFILDKHGNLWCLELNTLPGMTPTSLLPQEAKAIGISYEQLCERVIALSLEKYSTEL